MNSNNSASGNDAAAPNFVPADTIVSAHGIFSPAIICCVAFSNAVYFHVQTVAGFGGGGSMTPTAYPSRRGIEMAIVAPQMQSLPPEVASKAALCCKWGRRCKAAARLTGVQRRVDSVPHGIFERYSQVPSHRRRTLKVETCCGVETC